MNPKTTNEEVSEQVNLPTVAGRMEMTHAAFQRACQVQLLHLQESPLPDNALVHTLCEAVRCSRECCEIAGGSETKEALETLREQLATTTEALRQSEAGAAVMRKCIEAICLHDFWANLSKEMPDKMVAICHKALSTSATR